MVSFETGRAFIEFSLQAFDGGLERTYNKYCANGRIGDETFGFGGPPKTSVYERRYFDFVTLS